MANPKDILKKAVSNNDCSAMCELVVRAFTTRNLLHYAHLSTKSYAAHNALAELYDGIVDKVDSLAETYQGQFGLLTKLSQPAASVPACICTHVKQEREWLCDHKNHIANGSQPIVNMLDELDAMYLKTIYKLSNLS